MSTAVETLRRLKEILENKSVSISDEHSSYFGSKKGTCKTVSEVPGRANRFDIELADGYQITISPVEVTANFVRSDANCCFRTVRVV